MSKLHRFSRNELLIGHEGQQALRDATVAVVGLGGVGSYAAEALCRAGVGRLVIVDFDDICLTNVNRQLHALDGTVGKAKSEVMAERLRLINPDADIIPYREFYGAESSDLLLSRRPDYLLDAIDHITSKLHLIQSCLERSIPLVSSMGAANKLDPGLIRVADIADTHTCRMARSIRKLLKRTGIDGGFKVVFSTEVFRSPAQHAGGCRDNCICPNRTEQQFSCEHRRVILGSISFIPGIFGLTMAGVAINGLLSAANCPDRI
jgi:tRNA A37 threonylcarbamoyladenosine dehydratase